MTFEERVSKASTNAIVRWLRHIRAEERRKLDAQTGKARES